jgi:outer membrane protein OmpA-like peptidoglycan-associated protein
MCVASWILRQRSDPLQLLGVAARAASAAGSGPGGTRVAAGRLRSQRAARRELRVRDSAEIDAASAGVLDVAAEPLNGCPNVAVRVKGNTDPIGSGACNPRLSERRAEGVRSHRIGGGVSASQLTAVGYGESQPIASNNTEEG